MSRKNQKYITTGSGINSGFTLIELSIVLIILGLMIGGIMAAVNQENRRAKQIELKTKMDAIEKALGAFVKKNSRLPCPADGTYAITVAQFGKEGGTAGGGDCGNGATYDGNGNRTAIGASPPVANFKLSNTAGGVVPVRALGLPDEYALDPWGGRFTYVVDIRMTATSAFTTYSQIDSTGEITVNDGSGNTRIANAVAIVLSHGPNGHGAYQLSGTRKTAGSTNANEQTNCHCTSAAAADVWSTTFVMGPNTITSSSDLLASFDDNLRYYTRANLLASSDVATENK
jgi:prepilin-type N-terminal cleavage/methylation domain-containing protein